MNSEHQSRQSAQPDKKIFEYACAILARRRYSVSEFRSKLDKKFPEQPEASSKMVELFLEWKYLDDSEYTRLFIQEQLRRKPQGLRLIKQKLRRKGINESTLSDAFQSQVIDENELIEQAASKKLRTIKNATPLQQKQKLYRFLISRGFSHDPVIRVLNKISG